MPIDYDKYQATVSKYLDKPSQLGAATDRMQGGMYSGLEFASREAGFNGLSDWASQQAQQNYAEAAKYIPTGPQRIEDIHGVSDALDYAGNVVVDQAPIFGQMLGAGVTGGLLAGPVGAAVASVGSTVPMHMGEAYERQKEEGIYDPNAVWASTAVNTAIETLPVHRFMSVAKGLGGGTIAKAAAKGMITEGGTEAVQGGVVDYSAGIRPSLEKEYVMNRVNEAVAGAIPGGLMTGGAHVYSSAKELPGEMYDNISSGEFDPMQKLKDTIGYKDAPDYGNTTQQKRSPFQQEKISESKTDIFNLLNTLEPEQREQWLSTNYGTGTARQLLNEYNTTVNLPQDNFSQYDEFPDYTKPETTPNDLQQIAQRVYRGDITEQDFVNLGLDQVQQETVFSYLEDMDNLQEQQASVYDEAASTGYGQEQDLNTTQFTEFKDENNEESNKEAPDVQMVDDVNFKESYRRTGKRKSGGKRWDEQDYILNLDKASKYRTKTRASEYEEAQKELDKYNQSSKREYRRIPLADAIRKEVEREVYYTESENRPEAAKRISQERIKQVADDIIQSTKGKGKFATEIKNRYKSGDYEGVVDFFDAYAVTPKTSAIADDVSFDYEDKLSVEKPLVKSKDLSVDTSSIERGFVPLKNGKRLDFIAAVNKKKKALANQDTDKNTVNRQAINSVLEEYREDIDLDSPEIKLVTRNIVDSANNTDLSKSELTRTLTKAINNVVSGKSDITEFKKFKKEGTYNIKEMLPDNPTTKDIIEVAKTMAKDISAHDFFNKVNKDPNKSKDSGLLTQQQLDEIKLNNLVSIVASEGNWRKTASGKNYKTYDTAGEALALNEEGKYASKLRKYENEAIKVADKIAKVKSQIKKIDPNDNTTTAKSYRRDLDDRLKDLNTELFFAKQRVLDLKKTNQVKADHNVDPETGEILNIDAIPADERVGFDYEDVSTFDGNESRFAEFPEQDWVEGQRPTPFTKRKYPVKDFATGTPDAEQSDIRSAQDKLTDYDEAYAIKGESLPLAKEAIGKKWKEFSKENHKLIDDYYKSMGEYNNALKQADEAYQKEIDAFIKDQGFEGRITKKVRQEFETDFKAHVKATNNPISDIYKPADSLKKKFDNLSNKVERSFNKYLLENDNVASPATITAKQTVEQAQKHNQPVSKKIKEQASGKRYKKTPGFKIKPYKSMSREEETLLSEKTKVSNGLISVGSGAAKSYAKQAMAQKIKVNADTYGPKDTVTVYIKKSSSKKDVNRVLDLTVEALENKADVVLASKKYAEKSGLSAELKLIKELENLGYESKDSDNNVTAVWKYKKAYTEEELERAELLRRIDKTKERVSSKDYFEPQLVTDAIDSFEAVQNNPTRSNKSSFKRNLDRALVKGIPLEEILLRAGLDPLSVDPFLNVLKGESELKSDLLKYKNTLAGEQAETPPTKDIKTKSINIWFRNNDEFSKLSNMTYYNFTDKNGTKWNSVEQAFQASKYLYTDKTDADKAVLAKIRKANPLQTKGLGRQFKITKMENWNTDKYDIMERILRHSFDQNAERKSLLLKTREAELTHDGGYKPDEWTTKFPELLTKLREEYKKEEGSKNKLKTDTPIFDTLPEYKPGQSTMVYAGVGSRQTPAKTLKQMSKVAQVLAELGYSLNSGKALGADRAFETGATNKNIFEAKQATPKTTQIAKEIHPRPEALGQYPLKLMARNTNQVFGEKLDSPVDFVLAYTPDAITDGKDRTIKTGGTGQAIDMASRKSIPVINLADPNWESKLLDMLDLDAPDGYLKDTSDVRDWSNKLKYIEGKTDKYNNITPETKSKSAIKTKPQSVPHFDESLKQDPDTDYSGYTLSQLGDETRKLAGLIRRETDKNKRMELIRQQQAINTQKRKLLKGNNSVAAIRELDDLDASGTKKWHKHIQSGNLKQSLESILSDRQAKFGKDTTASHVIKRVLKLVDPHTKIKKYSEIPTEADIILRNEEAGIYNPKLNLVIIQNDVNDDLGNRVIVHEAIHAVTHSALHGYKLGKPVNARIKKLGDEITNIQKVMIEYYKKHPEEKSFYSDYSTFDVHEFMAVALTDFDVMKSMARIPYKRKTLLNSFSDTIRRFLGIRPLDQNVLNAMLDISGEVFDEAGNLQKENIKAQVNIKDNVIPEWALENVYMPLSAYEKFRTSVDKILNSKRVSTQNKYRQEYKQENNRVKQFNKLHPEIYAQVKKLNELREKRLAIKETIRTKQKDRSTAKQRRVIASYTSQIDDINQNLENLYNKKNKSDKGNKARKESLKDINKVLNKESKERIKSSKTPGNIKSIDSQNIMTTQETQRLADQYTKNLDVKVNVLSKRKALAKAKELKDDDMYINIQLGHQHGFASDKQNKDGSYNVFVNDSIQGPLRHEILQHEIGHVIQYHHLDNATDKEAENILIEYANWLEKHDKDSAYIKDLITSKKSEKAALLYLKQYGMVYGDMNNVKIKNVNKNIRDYLTNFDEWFADEAGKALARHTAPRTVVQKFFNNLVNIWRKLFKKETEVEKYILRLKDKHDIQPLRVDLMSQKLQRVHASFVGNMASNSTVKKAMDTIQKVLLDKDYNMRRLGGGKIEAFNKLADLMYKPRGTQAVDNTYWHNKLLQLGKYDARVTTIMRGATPQAQAKVMQELYNENLPDSKALSRTVKIRELFRDLRKYMLDAGVEVPNRKNYFPQIVDPEYTADHHEEFIAMMKRYPKEMQAIADKWNKDLEAAAEYKGVLVQESEKLTADDVPQLLFDNIVRGDLMDEIKSERQQTPHVRFINHRIMSFLKGDDAILWKNKYLQYSVTDAAVTYITQAVKRVEFEKRFGKLEDSKNELTRYVFLKEELGGKDSYTKEETDAFYNEAKWANKMELLMLEAEYEGATQKEIQTARDALAAEMGTHGRDTAKWLNENLNVPLPKSHAPINSTLQKASSTVMSVANVFVLGLSTLTSLLDPVGIAVRTGNLSQAISSFKVGIQSYFKKDRKDLEIIAEMIGSISDVATKEALAHGYNMVNMTPSIRKMNDKFFHLIGLEQWTKMTRLMATDAALSFLKRHDQNPTKHSDRFLKELGLKKGDIKYDKTGRVRVLTYDEYKIADKEEQAQDDRVKSAIAEFVDTSILRPNPSMRPIWASDPHYAILFHLKSFMYTFQKTIINPLWHEAKQGNYAPLLAAGAYIPLAISIGVIKDIIKTLGDDDDDWIPTYKENWGIGEYMLDGAEKSGLTGIAQPIFDMRRSVKYGGTWVGGLFGPALEPTSTFTQLPVPLNYFYRNL